MKIAQFKPKDKTFEVSWLLFTPPTFRLLHAGGRHMGEHQGVVFDDAAGVLPERSGLVVECRLVINESAGIGFTACSTKDEFDLGKGLKKSLQHAIADLQDNAAVKVKTDELWKALFADGLIGPVIKGDFGHSWSFSPLGKELARRFSTVTRQFVD